MATEKGMSTQETKDETLNLLACRACYTLENLFEKINCGM